MKIVAVVVTYNRLPLLKQVIAALKKQTIPVAQILIVNNSATDGTKEWLATQHSLYTIEQENKGGSGGYHTGVKYACEQNPDWIWMMDDDALPAADCLENLLKYKEASACLHPIHLDEQGRLQDEERWLNPASCNVVSSFNLSYTHGKKIWYRNTGSFEGMLVSAALVQQIGYPDTRFFMVHDDLSYAYLASKHTNVAVVSDAIIQKLPVSPTEASHLRYLYYEHRNLWLIEQYVAADLKGFDGYRKRRIKLKFIYSLYAIWNRSEFKNKWRAYKMLYRAYQDYRLKKEGNTF